jgi:hypothetical protein
MSSPEKKKRLVSSSALFNRAKKLRDDLAAYIDSTPGADERLADIHDALAVQLADMFPVKEWS